MIVTDTELRMSVRSHIPFVPFAVLRAFITAWADLLDGNLDVTITSRRKRS